MHNSALLVVLPLHNGTETTDLCLYNLLWFITLSVCVCVSRRYRISRPIRRTMIFSLEILEKNNDDCILILVIYWKKTGLLHTKISNHNIIYSSQNRYTLRNV
jgi:hypothetical protein